MNWENVGFAVGDQVSWVRTQTAQRQRNTRKRGSQWTRQLFEGWNSNQRKYPCHEE